MDIEAEKRKKQAAALKKIREVPSYRCVLSQFIAELGVPAADVMWDASGTVNRVNEDNASYFPPMMPGNGWPTILLTKN